MWMLNFGSVAVMTALLLYAGENQSGHSAFPPLLLGPAFLFFLGLSVVVWVRARRNSVRLSAVVGTVIGSFGLILPFALHATCILRQYDVWCQTGMPMPPVWRGPFLVGYAALFSAATAGAVFMMTKRKSGANIGVQDTLASSRS